MTASAIAIFRPAIGTDLEAIRTVAWETWADTYGGEIDPDTIQDHLEHAYAPGVLQSEIEREDCGVFVLELPAGDTIVPAGGIIGFARLYLQSSSTGYQGVLGAVYLMPRVQGRGLGRALLDGCEAWFASHQVRDLELVVTAMNARARRFFEAAGWQLETELDASMGEQVVREARYRKLAPRQARSASGSPLQP
jgi:ribosomal protein S18 acetylase RimI-like enzyme